MEKNRLDLCYQEELAHYHNCENRKHIMKIHGRHRRRRRRRHHNRIKTLTSAYHHLRHHLLHHLSDTGYPLRLARQEE
jgi:hypothetical protein